MTLALTEVEDIFGRTDDLSSEMDRQAFVSFLNAFLKSQPTRERNMFILRYFYMESVEAIAQTYHLKESNVLVILSRTRQKLKKAMEKEGYTV